MFGKPVSGDFPALADPSVRLAFHVIEEACEARSSAGMAEKAHMQA
jgi:hypothetical protein